MNGPQNVNGNPNPCCWTGSPLQTVDMYTESYSTDKSWLSNIEENHCYYCTETIDSNEILLQRGCACKAAVHVACFTEATLYYRDSKRGPVENDNLFKCGLCKTPIFGTFNEQYHHTVLAWNAFQNLDVQRQRDTWIKTLPPIIFSLEQLIKHIRRDWRSNVEVNELLSGLLVILGQCHAVVIYLPEMEISNDTTKEIQADARKKCFSCRMLAVAERDGATTLSVQGIDWLLRTIGNFSSKGNFDWSRNCLMCILKHLFAMIQHTTMAPRYKEDGNLDMLPVPAAAEKNAKTHRQAQDLIVKMLNKCIGDDLLQLNRLRTEVFDFLLKDAALCTVGERRASTDMIMIVSSQLWDYTVQYARLWGWGTELLKKLLDHERCVYLNGSRARQLGLILDC